MSNLFVTATGTDIGKTHVMARLIRELRAEKKTVKAIKPVISGFTWHNLPRTDIAIILDALGLESTPENVKAISPWRFDEPVSPDMAARHEKRMIDFDEVVDFCRLAMVGPEDVTLIEGVGGVLVPITDTHTIADLISALEISCLVVAGSYLGTINHTLLTVETMRARGLDVSAVIISESRSNPVPVDETMVTMRRFLPGIDIRALPRGKNSDLDPIGLADLLD